VFSIGFAVLDIYICFVIVSWANNGFILDKRQRKEERRERRFEK